ncbi:MAG: biofilm protein TabA [Enterobacterales bacterium]|jgi:biofilm protein TabA
MIIDKLENWEHYHFGAAWKLAFDFLKSLTPDSIEKKYILQGDDIFAYVMSYETKEPELAKLEAHEKYVDIQTVLIGGEGFEWFTKDGLEVDVPYNKSKDVEFFKRSCPGTARVDVLPDTFVMFYPQDAHMPALIVDGKPEFIKKVVVKIKSDLLTEIN